MKLQETSVEWALRHLRRFYDSDFYPKSFEFEAISHHWTAVKPYILSLELEKYVPKTPFTTLAPKAGSTYRIVQQLDPIDCLIFTALVYELSTIIESYRIPASERIACSYRVKPDLNGSFFDRNDDGWNNFLLRSEALSTSHRKGYVIVCDITDFYNQISLHRINNIVSEAGGGQYDAHATVLEQFLTQLNTNTSRGIPVGPAASIVLAEAIMGDIDRKISAYTRDFTRYVDDIRIFMDSEQEAAFLLHELSKYLYTSHRLVLSERKTAILSTTAFMKRYQKSAEKQEREAILEKAIEILDAKREELSIPYGELFDEAIDSDGSDEDNEDEDVMESLEDYEKFEATVTAYRDLLKRCLASERLDVSLVRHLLRQATTLRVRSLVPIVLKHFERLLPVIREVVIYLERVLTETIIKKHEKLFQLILSSDYLKLPLVNIWVFTLLQNQNFNDTGVSADYNSIMRIREQALIAKARNDRTWVKDHKDSLDVLGPWDKRAVLHAASVLSADEMKHWAGLASARGDIVDKSICAHLVG